MAIKLSCLTFHLCVCGVRGSFSGIKVLGRLPVPSSATWVTFWTPSPHSRPTLKPSPNLHSTDSKPSPDDGHPSQTRGQRPSSMPPSPQQSSVWGSQKSHGQASVNDEKDCCTNEGGDYQKRLSDCVNYLSFKSLSRDFQLGVNLAGISTPWASCSRMTILLVLPFEQSCIWSMSCVYALASSFPF